MTVNVCSLVQERADNIRAGHKQLARRVLRWLRTSTHGEKGSHEIIKIVASKVVEPSIREPSEWLQRGLRQCTSAVRDRKSSRHSVLDKM